MRWLRPLFRRSAVERDMDTELRFHYERLVEDFRKRGMDPTEARRHARLEFGGLEQVKDDSREAHFADRFESLWRNLRTAWRNLSRNPGFSAIALTTLALGIGVNTLLFSVVDQLLLRTLPVREPQRLVLFHGNFVTPGMYRDNERLMAFSWPKYKDFRDRCEVFGGVAARFVTPGSLEYQGSAESVDVELVSGNYFDVLGIGPALGRVLTPDDGKKVMGEPVVVLGYSYWQRRFASDPAIVGRQVRINGMPMTVVGVSESGFHSLDRGQNEDVRVPIVMKDLFTPNWRGLGQRFWAWLNIVARVKPGISLTQAQAGANLFYHRELQDEADLLGARYARRKEFLADHLDLIPAATGMVDKMGDQKAFLTELAAIAGVVLLIATVNLAGLLVARTAARHRELAIRLALGAGHLGVIRQLLAENLLLTLVGGTFGIVLAASLAQPAAQFLIAPDAGQLIDYRLDWRVTAFGLALTTFTAAILCLAPFLQMRRLQLADVLKTESGASSSRAQVRLRKLMVAVQISFSAWLMIAAGLFARSLAQVKAANLGFEKTHLITFEIDPMMSGRKADETVAEYRRLRTALAALPGVLAVSNSDYGVLTGNVNLNSIEIEGYRPPPPDKSTLVRVMGVAPNYFKALGTPLLAGRDFTEADLQMPPRSIIVNEGFAKEYFGGRNPVGRHIQWPGDKTVPMEIVGLVQNQRYDGPAENVYPFDYVPIAESLRASFYIRTAQQPQGLLPTVRRTVEKEAPGVPIDRLRTMEQFFDSHIGDRSRIAVLASFFGILATLLAAIGLYGVMAYTLSRRTREIGIRIAVGAARADVMRMVIREVTAVIGAGLLIGVPSGLAVARLVRSQLYHISPMDLRVTTVAAVIVAATALLAGFLPARRATAVDPMKALRWD